MVSLTDHRWEFRVKCLEARKVYLVLQTADGLSSTIPMEEDSPQGIWTVQRRLPPGEYDFTYFISDGQTLYNHGRQGLRMRKINRIGNASEHAQSEEALAVS